MSASLLPASLPWWWTRRWQRALHDRLLERGRRRFALLLSDQVALGATNFVRRTVEVNPLALPFPEDPAERARVRHAPDAPLLWEQLLATALVEHEAGHICHSGEKPTASTLGWLWNALEDERQERRQWRATPELEPLFALLGDAAWRENQPTTDLLAGCLLWRWKEDHGASQRLFRPDPVEAKRWTREIRPLVEAAWEAASSDAVAQLAREILARLGLPEDAPPPAGLPQTICAGVLGKRLGGDAPDGAPQPSPATPLPDGVGLPTAGHPPRAFDASQAEADPTALLAQVEGFARDLALALHPPTPNQRPRPHRSRGDLVLERALEGQERPFAYERVAAPARQVALLVLVDQTGSMGKRTDAHSRMTGAVTATMLLHRAAELASIRFGVWGFTFGNTPAIHRPLHRGGSEAACRRIAGMDGWASYTELAPVFHQAVAALAACPRQEQRLLVVLHDGDLEEEDAELVRAEVDTLAHQRILLQQIFIGNDARAVDANRAVFGRVLACPQVADLAPVLRTWLRATLG